jgi:hypothetical protein
MVRAFRKNGEYRLNKKYYGMDTHSFQTEMKTQNEVGTLGKAGFKGYENLSLEKMKLKAGTERKRITEQAKVQKDF